MMAMLTSTRRLTVQDAGKHGDALLGESTGGRHLRPPGPSSRSQFVTPKLNLLAGQLKHEVLGEAITWSESYTHPLSNLSRNLPPNGGNDRSRLS